MQNAIAHKVDEITAHLGLLATFIASSENVTFNEFKHFTSKQLDYTQEIVAFEWVPYVPISNLKSFESAFNITNTDKFYVKEQSKDGSFLPVSERSFYYPVAYVNPLAGNEDVIGFDLASTSVRSTAINKAKILNELVLSEQIDLVQNNTKKALYFYSPCLAIRP